MKNFTTTPLVALAAIYLSLLLNSCGSVKYPEMVMMQNIENQLAGIDTLPALKIQPDDLLSIQVSSRVPEAIIAFQNLQSTATAGAGENALGIQEGYRVDESGNIHLPYIGKIQATGKSVMQLRQELSNKLLAYIPDATVQVRFLNFRVTIIGEVTRPNAYIIPNERLNILEAIGMAGDFTPYARRSNVLIIRERNQVREMVRVNTQDASLFSSPYFYLQPNDIIYIEPLEAKQYATQGDFFSRYAPVIYPVASLVTLIIGLAVTGNAN
jgi:polysaccharide export outer membrane protein